MATPRLRTARLDLAPLRPADADEMTRVLADPALYAFTGGVPPDAGALRERYERLSAGHSRDRSETWHNWIVRTAAGGVAVGTVQATVSSDGLLAEIAWVIGVPWQGLGYASESARALVAWLDATNVTAIVAHIHPGHGASAAVAARLGLEATDEVENGERVWRRLSPRAP